MKNINNSGKAAILAAIGSGFEYYDFVIYGMMAKYLSEVFFPVSDSLVNTMQIFSIFAVGYFVRPLGGACIGYFADKYGRKKAFLFTTFTMAFATLFIGLIPSYNQIGFFAPCLLVICRIVQGVSFGAELPGAMTIVSEFSQKANVGKYTSIVLSSTSLGSLLAVLVLLFLSKLFTTDEIIELGIWRVPFIMGGLLACASYFIRKKMTETPEFIEYSKSDLVNTTQILPTLKKNLLNILISLGLTFYLATLIIINIYFPTFISKYFAYDLPQIYQAMSVGMVFSFASILFFGVFSDYVSRVKMLLASLLISLLIMPFMYYLLNQNEYKYLLLFFILYQGMISMYFISYLPIISRLFPVGIRYTATAISYNITFSIASIIPTICSYLYLQNESPLFLSWFFIFAILIAGASFAILRRSAGKEFLKAGI